MFSYDEGIHYACKPEEPKIRRQDLSLSKTFTDSNSRRCFCPLSLLQYRRESIARLLLSGSRSKFPETDKETERKGQKWAEMGKTGQKLSFFDGSLPVVER